MAFIGSKKSSLMAVPFLKKRLRRLTSIGFDHLTITDWNFTVYFTLHRNEKTPLAFFTSETIHNERNPEWSSLDFPIDMQYLQEFQIRLWITTSDTCRLFLQYDVHLDRSLLPDIQKDEIPHGYNRLWLEIFGYRFTDYKNDYISQWTDDEQPLGSTKSYNRFSMLRMMNILQAIRIEKRISKNCLQQIETYLEKNEDYLSKIKDRECRQLRIEYLKQSLAERTAIYHQRWSFYEEKQKLIEQRKIQLHPCLSKLISQQERINSFHDHLTQTKSNLNNVQQFITYRQKLLLNELYRYIYPIDCDKQNHYSILNLKLPVANEKIYQTLTNRDKEIIAAIEYSAHFVLIIAEILSLPLRHRIDFTEGSPVKIVDQTLEFNEFLLDPSFDLNRFRYGFYLLNRNIGQILYHCHLTTRRIDYRKTLENLKYFLDHFPA